MEASSVDVLGPVDYLVVEFPAEEANFSGEMAAELTSLVDRELVEAAPLARQLRVAPLHERQRVVIEAEPDVQAVLLDPLALRRVAAIPRSARIRGSYDRTPRPCTPLDIRMTSSS